MVNRLTLDEIWVRRRTVQRGEQEGTPWARIIFSFALSPKWRGASWRLWVKAPGAENAGPSLRTPRASALLRGVVASTPAMPPRGKVRRPGADRAPIEISSLKLTGDHIAAREAAGGAHSPPLSDQQHTCAGRARRDWKSRSRLVYVSRTPARKAGVFDLRTRTRTRDGLSAGGSRIRAIGPGREGTAVRAKLRFPHSRNG